MPDTRLTKQAFLENCALASRPGRTSRSSACWAAQVCSFLHFMSPIVDGKPQRIDTSVVSAHLQRRMYDAVNGSDLREVREWLEIRGPVSCDNYQMAHYLQAVASKTSRRRLAQFRMGSHILGVETGRWQRLPRAERLCPRCSCSVVDDEAHMIWGCPALIDQRVQHSELFAKLRMLLGVLLKSSVQHQCQTLGSRTSGSWHPFCGFVMIIVQSWRGMVPAGFEWTMTLSAGCEWYLCWTQVVAHAALG